jgi:hypothetical protein
MQLRISRFFTEEPPMSARSYRVSRRAAALLLPFLMVACQSFGKRDCDSCADGCPKVLEPKVLHRPTMHAAAHDLDHMEHHLEWGGSVTAAAPSVWGQARLQQYREEFEAQMKEELGNFKESLQGSIARSDQAFLLNATAISAALETPVRPVRTQLLPAGTYLRGGTANGLPANPKDTNNVIVLDKDYQTIVNTSDKKVDAKAELPGLVIDKDGVGKAGDINVFVDRKDALKFVNDFKRFKDGEKLALALEPERYLEQKKRYLDLLANIRRTNEGDDTADAPGYQLVLMRVPVSVLPGKRTDVGHGAEITMSLTPVLGDDLLPSTFRNLVINDLVHQLGFPITQALDPSRDPQAFEFLKLFLTRENQRYLEAVTLVSDYLVASEIDKARAAVRALSADEWRTLLRAVDASDRALLAALQAGQPVTGGTPLHATRDGLVFGVVEADTGRAQPPAKAVGPAQCDPVPGGAPRGPAGERRPARQSLANGFTVMVPQFAPGTNARTALPTSQLVDVYGTAYSFDIALGAREAFGRQAANRGYAHLPEVQGYLKEELNAAFDLLAQPRNSALWEFCTPDLVHLVRTQALDQLDKRRRQFRQLIAGLAASEPNNTDRRDPAQLSRAAAFAWAILIDAALLNDKLCGEMKAQAARGGCAPPAADWLPLFLPKPRAEECRAFNDYVKARWPIQVFALDPAIQEQNLADRLATRRELQLSLSLAFAHGYMNFNQLSRYARRLEAEYETIDVNRTTVGFNHGPTTFGWRFHPRFQTPDTPSNLELVGRDLLYGGPNRAQLLRERRIEPGPRECVALVVMPSFVPSVRIDTASAFFPLNNPKRKLPDHADGVRLGRTVKALTTVGLSDAHCYRDGDAERIVARAKQLEARLPLQSNTFPVPTEGTLGGFELFNTSTKSLSPELDGFYGAPGIHPDGNNTLFLVGDHFSPLRTKVLIGNAGVKDAPIPAAPAKKTDGADAGTKAVGVVEGRDITLLSRQVIQIKVPTGLMPLEARDAEGNVRYYFTVHVATPYGVSRELLVPAVCPAKPCPPPAPAPKTPGTSAAPATNYSMAVAELGLSYAKAGQTREGKYLLGLAPGGGRAAIRWTDPASVAPPALLDVSFDFKYKDCPLTVKITGDVIEKDKAYTLSADQMKELNTQLFQALNGFGPFTDDTNPLAQPLSATVRFTPKDPNRAVAPTSASGPFALKYACRIPTEPAVVPMVVPAQHAEPVPPMKLP